MAHASKESIEGKHEEVEGMLKTHFSKTQFPKGILTNYPDLSSGVRHTDCVYGINVTGTCFILTKTESNNL